MEKLTHYAKDENFVLIGDLNATQFGTSAENFFDIYSFENLTKETARFKNPYNAKCK